MTNTIMGNEKGTFQTVLAGFFLSVWMIFAYL